MKQLALFSILIYLLNILEIDGSIRKKVELQTLQAKFDEHGPIRLTSSIRKFNRTHTVVSVNCSLTAVIDYHYHFQLEIRKWSDGGWKNNYVTYEGDNPCVQIKFAIGKPWLDILAAAKIPDKCPFQPGFYQLIDYYLDVSAAPLVTTTGKFMVLMDVFKLRKWLVQAVLELLITDVLY